MLWSTRISHECYTLHGPYDPQWGKKPESKDGCLCIGGGRFCKFIIELFKCKWFVDFKVNENVPTCRGESHQEQCIVIGTEWLIIYNRFIQPSSRLFNEIEISPGRLATSTCFEWSCKVLRGKYFPSAVKIHKGNEVFLGIGEQGFLCIIAVRW